MIAEPLFPGVDLPEIAPPPVATVKKKKRKMIVRRKKREREIFGLVPQRRTARPEKRAIYDAVLRARAKGARVWRAGRHAHVVVWGDRRTVTDDKLLAMFPG